MGIQAIIQLLVGLLGEYLLKPASAAKYAKWLLTARDYLNLLFPSDVYPMGAVAPHITGMSKDKVAVPLDAVKEASEKQGFSLGTLMSKL